MVAGRLKDVEPRRVQEGGRTKSGVEDILNTQSRIGRRSSRPRESFELVVTYVQTDSIQLRIGMGSILREMSIRIFRVSIPWSLTRGHELSKSFKKHSAFDAYGVWPSFRILRPCDSSFRQDSRATYICRVD